MKLITLLIIALLFAKHLGHIEHFEDGSGIAFGIGYCIPFTPCAEE
jgi:hypothetical protein